MSSKQKDTDGRCTTQSLYFTKKNLITLAKTRHIYVNRRDWSTSPTRPSLVTGRSWLSRTTWPQSNSHGHGFRVLIVSWENYRESEGNRIACYDDEWWLVESVRLIETIKPEIDPYLAREEPHRYQRSDHLGVLKGCWRTVENRRQWQEAKFRAFDVVFFCIGIFETGVSGRWGHRTE